MFKDKLIKLLGGFTKNDLNIELSRVTENSNMYNQTTAISNLQDINKSLESDLESIARYNLIALERIDNYLPIFKDLETERRKILLDLLNDVKDMLTRNNIKIVDMLHTRNIEITNSYILQIDTSSRITRSEIYHKVCSYYPKKDEQYKIRILSLNIEVIATVDTDITLDQCTHFSFRYIDEKNNTKFANPYNVEILDILEVA